MIFGATVDACLRADCERVGGQRQTLAADDVEQPRLRPARRLLRPGVSERLRSLGQDDRGSSRAGTWPIGTRALAFGRLRSSGAANWDEFVADVRDTIRSGGQGTPFEQVSDAVARMMLLVDSESNRGANLVLCETEDDLRRVDAALNEVTPAGGRGARTSVEMYEVALDEKPGT